MKGGRQAGLSAVAAVVVWALTAGPTLAVATPTAGLPPKVKGSNLTGNPIPLSAPFDKHLKGGRVGFCGGDDWEPEIASDHVGHVYLVWAHYAGNTKCDPASGNPNRIYIRVSSDGGKTFGRAHVVDDRPAGQHYRRQVDCVVTVDERTGAVYVTFLAWGLHPHHTDVIVAKSTDFGATFTSAKTNGPQCQSCDHPWIAASGRNVYVAYAHGPNHFLSRSSDGGGHWAEKLVQVSAAVAFPEGSVVDRDGNVWMAWGDCLRSDCGGRLAATYQVSKTDAGTSQTTFTSVATAPAGPVCPYHTCSFAPRGYFGPQDDIAIDDAGNLYLAWQDGQDHTSPGSPPIVQLSSSTDGGATWNYVGRADDKNAQGCAGSKCYALFPRVEGGKPGEVAVMWMDDRQGDPLDHIRGWGVWLRTSFTGGRSWTGPSQQVSRYDPTRPESRRDGFRFPYGDYQGIDLSPAGTTAFLLWGEGFDWLGGPDKPGHVIYRRVTLPAPPG